MKKCLTLVLLVLFAVGVFAGCENAKQPSRDEVVYADWEAGNRSPEEVGAYLYTRYIRVAEQRVSMLYIDDIGKPAQEILMRLVCAFRNPDETSLTLSRKEMEEEVRARFGVQLLSISSFGEEYDPNADTLTISFPATEVALSMKGTEVRSDGSFAVSVRLNEGTENAYEKVYTFRMTEGTFRLETCILQNFSHTEWTAENNSEEDALYQYVTKLVQESFYFFPYMQKEDYYSYFCTHYWNFGLSVYRSETASDLLNVPAKKLLALTREVFALDQEPDPATAFGTHYHADTETVDLAIGGQGGDVERIYLYQIRLDGARLELAYSTTPYGEKQPDGTDAVVLHAVFEKNGAGILSIRSWEIPSENS